MFVITLVEIPLVLPPTVAGIGLLAAFAGRIGLLSSIFDPIGVNVVFTTTAVVLAICFVAGPFYIRQAIAAFETLDRDVLDAARVDGASQFRLLTSISIPLCSAGLAAGAALAFARGVGEFGATIMFAGNLRGVTQTMPLLIYQDFDLNFDLALAISALLVVVSAAVLITVKLVSRLPGPDARRRRRLLRLGRRSARLRAARAATDLVLPWYRPDLPMFCLASGESRMGQVSRRALLARAGIGTGAGVFALLGVTAAPAFGAASIADLANVRLVCVGQAHRDQLGHAMGQHAAAVADSDAADLIRAVRVQEQGHFRTLAPLLGATAPSDDDYTFTLPEGRTALAGDGGRVRASISSRCWSASSSGRPRARSIPTSRHRSRASSPATVSTSARFPFSRAARPSWTGSRPRSASKTPETSSPRSSRIRWYP